MGIYSYYPGGDFSIASSQSDSRKGSYTRPTPTQSAPKQEKPKDKAKLTRQISQLFGRREEGMAPRKNRDRSDNRKR